MGAFNSISQLVGKTPILELVNIEKKYGLDCKIFAKLEMFRDSIKE